MVIFAQVVQKASTQTGLNDMYAGCKGFKLKCFASAGGNLAYSLLWERDTLVAEGDKTLILRWLRWVLTAPQMAP